MATHPPQSGKHRSPSEGLSDCCRREANNFKLLRIFHTRRWSPKTHLCCAWVREWHSLCADWV